MDDSAESITEKDTPRSKWLRLKAKVGLRRNFLSHASSILLLLFPYLLFGTTTLPWFGNFYGWTIPVIVIFLFCLSFFWFFLASYTNPGILPRQNDSYNLYDHIKGTKRTGRILPQIEVTVNGKFLKIKYCYTCNMYRAPRSIHCSVCDVCVNKFDHHCKWLGNCVGSNNYLTFISFIFTTFVLIVIMISLSIIRIIAIKSKTNNLSGILESSFLLLYIVLSGWFIVGLIAYHTYLIFTNQTTNEQLKSTYGDFNPWNRGIRQNISDVFLSKMAITISYKHSPMEQTIYNPNPNMCYFLRNSSLEKEWRNVMRMGGVDEIYHTRNEGVCEETNQMNSEVHYNSSSSTPDSSEDNSLYNDLGMTYTSIGTNFSGNGTRYTQGHSKYKNGEINIKPTVGLYKPDGLPKNFEGSTPNTNTLREKEIPNFSRVRQMTGVNYSHLLPDERYNYTNRNVNVRQMERKTIPDIQKKVLHDISAGIHTIVHAPPTSDTRSDMYDH